jgi:hypothetical protein
MEPSTISIPRIINYLEYNTPFYKELFTSVLEDYYDDPSSCTIESVKFIRDVHYSGQITYRFIHDPLHKDTSGI